MKCPQCSFENKPNKKYCTKCGAELILKCPNCDTKIEVGDIFCGECGHNLRKPSETLSIDRSQPQSYTPKFLADKILTARNFLEGERKHVTTSTLIRHALIWIAKKARHCWRA